jgi:putative ABC transport system permease protein
VPYRRSPSAFVVLVVRSELPPEAVGGAVRTEVQAVDPDQPVFSIQTIDEALVEERWPFRIFGSLFAIFAVMGLLVSAVGLYAVMAYAVTQRTQEIGMRMALGADARNVSWLILKRGLAQIAIGLALGLTGAYFIATVIGSLLVQVTPRDPVTFTVIAALLTAVAVAACLVPARRATRLDPLTALRID